MFSVQEVRRGRGPRGVTVLSRDETEVSRGVGGGGKFRKLGRKYVGRMTLKGTRFNVFLRTKCFSLDLIL